MDRYQICAQCGTLKFDDGTPCLACDPHIPPAILTDLPRIWQEAVEYTKNAEQSLARAVAAGFLQDTSEE